MEIMKLLEYAKSIARKVDSFIVSTVDGKPRELYEAALHYIRAGGKRLRPLMTVLAARIAGGSEDVAIPAAAAIEVLHTFTLVHDDIIDRDEFRRGVPTVHKLWGTDTAIVAGDILYAYAYRCLLRATELGIEHSRIVKAVEYLTEGAIRVAEGQMLDMLFSRRDRVTVDEYIEMVERKTSALFVAAVSMGAVLGGGDEMTILRLREAMRLAGIAFQIRDDILGLVGDEKILGKPILSDLREGKRTILVIYAMQRLDDEHREWLLKVLGNSQASVEELKKAAEMITNTGAVDYADKLAREYAGKARHIIESIECRDANAKEMLFELVDYLVERRF